MARHRKKDIVKAIGMAIFLAVAIVSALYANADRLFPKSNVQPGADCYVDFIECGQGDSTLLVSEGVVTLIDATTRDESYKVVEHLKKRGVKKVDHFVLTHPHEDHIGGAISVLDQFEVENIYMKRPTKGTEPTTSVYINLLKKIKELGKTVHAVAPGDTFDCGLVKLSVLGPLNEYKDLNDQSIVLRAEYGEISFLFTGDQERSAEEDLIEQYGTKLQSTVLKVGHHGGNTSSGTAFLKSVKPRYAVISCGENNSYGHPHEETISRLKKQGVICYRTDQKGTITFSTDGVNIEELTK